ncbi:MAG: hypothetical protein WC536_03505 [Patescibacteria group bacterium]
MAKISISKVLAKRKWTKVGSVFAVLVLGFFIVQLLVIKNPWGVKAEGMVDYGTYCKPLFTGATLEANMIVCDNKNLIVDGGNTLTIYGQHTFKNVTITGSGSKLTHAALVPTTDFDVDTSELNSLGQEKKVDLIVDGDLTLESGGVIDVSGQGYPGGESEAGVVNDGYGPGRSQALPDSSPTKGAGYGGKGGGSSDPYGLIYPTNYDSGVFSESQFYLGSGSGGSHINYQASRWADGASGGGRIHLKINGSLLIRDSSSFINANGNDGTSAHDPGYCSAGSGGGSGGTIWIEAYDVATAGSAYSVAGGDGTTGNDGEAGFASIDSSVLINNINVKGGRGSTGCDGSPRYGGGGGRLVVKKIATNVTIKKTLSALQRPYGTDDTSFNPYALQRGDLIRVNLTITNVTGSIDVNDDILQNMSSLDPMYCVPKYISGSDGTSDTTTTPDVQGIYISKKVNWTGAKAIDRNGDGKVELYYDCKVQPSFNWTESL